MTQPGTHIIKAADTLQETKAHVLLKDTKRTHPSAEHVPRAVHRQFSGCPRQNTAVSVALLSQTKRLYSSATSSHSHRSVSLPSRCFRVASWHKVAVFSDRGWWRGEFLAVTFSWEMIGPTPGAVSCEPGSGGESKTGQVFLKVEQLASPAKSCEVSPPPWVKTPVSKQRRMTVERK